MGRLGKRGSWAAQFTVWRGSVGKRVCAIRRAWQAAQVGGLAVATIGVPKGTIVTLPLS